MTAAGSAVVIAEVLNKLWCSGEELKKSLVQVVGEEIGERSPAFIDIQSLATMVAAWIDEVSSLSIWFLLLVNFDSSM